jgi:hypothetical protein
MLLFACGSSLKRFAAYAASDACDFSCRSYRQGDEVELMSPQNDHPPAESASSVASALARYLKEHAGGRYNNDELFAFMERLAAAGGNRPIDALAFVAWAGPILSMAISMMPDDEKLALLPSKRLLSVAEIYIENAERALESLTGVPAKSITGETGAVH